MFTTFPIFCFIILLNIIKSHCFVYDTSKSIYLDPKLNSFNRKTHFGYSLDLARSNGKVFALVGSPKDGPEVEGSLWACGIQYPNLASNCQMRTIDLRDKDATDVLQDQLLGASVLAINAFGEEEVWACAPRFQKLHNQQWGNDYEKYMTMLGQCYVYKEKDEFRNPRRVTPLEPQFYGRDGFGKLEYVYGTIYSELGMSIHYDDVQRKIFFGAPGTWNWTGTTVATDPLGDNPILTQPWSMWNPKLNDYAGYSLTSGNVYAKTARPRQLVLGAPRAGDSRTGAIFVVEFEGTPMLKNVATKNGRQPGEYFGASVCTVDLDGDGIMEIIVGAPLFINNYDVNRFKSTNYDEGRVAILVTNQRNKEIREAVSIFGRKKGARFGQSLVSLDDLDGDGLGDFAVGSPYENEYQGVVRIFFGKKDVLKIQDALQTIEASQMGMSPKGFGISFSFHQVDADGNNLADLAVGAHLSSQAFLLLRRPVVSVQINLTSSLTEIDTTKPQEFSIWACVNLMSSQSSLAKLNADLNLTADHRAVFKTLDQKLSSDWVNMKVLLSQGQESCTKFPSVRLKSNRTSAAEPSLVFLASIKQNDFKFDGVVGVLDPRTKYETTLEIPFAHVCGSDGMCDVDLEVSVSTKFRDQQFVIGSSNSLEQIVTVRNKGTEPAYLINVKLPNLPAIGVNYQPPECIIPKDQKYDKTMSCKIPNPIGVDASEDIRIIYNMSTLVGGDREIIWKNIEAKTDKDSIDNNPINNKANYTLRLITEADVKISSPKDFETVKGYIKKDFQQIYQISNELSSPIRDLDAWVNIPTHHNDRELIKVQSVHLDSLKCDKGEKKVNYLDKSKPKEFSCYTKDVTLTTYKCPKFHLSSNNSNRVLTLNLDLLIVNDEIFESFDTFTSEGYVSLPEGLRQELEIINKGPDSVLYMTYLVEKVNPWSKANLGPILMIVIPVVMLFAIIIIVLFCCGCFKRKVVDRSAFQQAESGKMLEDDEPVDEIDGPDSEDKQV